MTEDIVQKCKKVVRNERLALGLTQEEFSTFSGIKYATYRQFEQKGKISFCNLVSIFFSINKNIEFENFLDSFEYNTIKERSRKDKESEKSFFYEPIISPSQKQITLDKEIFGNDLFYSVENGHLYEVSSLISIILSHHNDQRIMLLLKYFGPDRLKSYVLKEKNIDLLTKFNRHVEFLQKKGL
ncbi:MAG: hypothetical protein COB67_05940 [SAR324 cluster bacterium]|uniref:HTH cro/C1-type domain-containing protein n=1 Tax=SAR324 cluster bacterium TaxID=2024889 RepID=A0A2A4T4T4_9DELT|nr:MAG: hypothetical protein COB67_05940 [SAR324 cluster bacterium]